MIDPLREASLNLKEHRPKGESLEVRKKRLYMRSIRRGIKEMDILLQGYAEANLAGMEAAALDRYEALLEENDQDLLQWVTGQVEAPAELADLVKEVSQTYQK